ncbi:MAG: HEAT repeat domain-containing protein [Chloroflexi bacterium]|nr:HEAT repeat domain-containing protein [Chloroflexota bacterium]
MVAIEDWIDDLDLTDGASRRVAETELLRHGEKAVRALIHALDTVSLRQKIVIVKLLGRTASTTALSAVRRALLDTQWLVRQAAVHALGYYPAETVLPLVYHSLYDVALLVRIEAVNTLGRLGHASAVPTLLAHLYSTTSEVETYTLIEALGSCGDRSLIPTIEPYLCHDHPRIATNANKAIVNLNRKRA